MIRFNGGIRIVQTLKTKINGEFLIVGEKIDGRIIINLTGYNILKNVYRYQNNSKKITYLQKKYKDYINELIKLRVLIDDNVKKESFVYITKKNVRLPLSSLNIELTDGCNLNCIHCYNDFGHRKARFIDYNSILELEQDLNTLNTFSISITGGECTLHPKFMEIIEFFIKRGYEITIFTNGQNYKSIFNVVNKYYYKKITIKISLDGFEKEHNIIRGKDDSYKNVIILLDGLLRYDNANVIVSSVAMKSNIDCLEKFKNNFKIKYPRYTYSADLITPSKYNQLYAFRVEEFLMAYDKAPFLFKENKNSEKKKFRCSGGISQCTLMVDGNVKICNGACSEHFKFKYNAFSDGLLKTWYDCGDNIKYFRKEKNKSNKECLKCPLKKECTITNCRVKAMAYTGDYNKRDPLACYITRRNQL